MTHIMHGDAEIHIVPQLEPISDVLGVLHIEADFVHHIGPLDVAVGVVDGAHHPLVPHGGHRVLQPHVSCRKVTRSAGTHT